MSFGYNLKKIRKEKGLSQRALGEKMGVKQQTIAQYEQILKAPKLETIERLADALDVPIDKLQKFSNSPTITINGKSFQTGKELIAELESTGNKEAIINIFDNYLNKKGQKKVIDYACDLAESTKYKKEEN